MGEKTIHALMARGFDSRTAKDLETRGHTLTSLKNKNASELRALNISEKQIKAILQKSRPPIPLENLIKVLQESRWTCCICRNSDQGVIVHHIYEYSSSRSHDEDNLVVLCLNHHGEAHTKRELQLNLTPDRLKEAKKWWINQVRQQDFQEVLSLTPHFSYSIWDYFNHNRLVELSQKIGIDISALPHYLNLSKEKRVHVDGTPAWALPNSVYMYSTGYPSRSREPYVLYSCLMEEVLEKVKWVKLYPEKWNRSFVNAMINENTIVVCKGAFYFKDLNSKKSSGSNQMRKGLRRCNGIHIEFAFDAWESTSSSAHALHLSGRSVVTVVCLVRSKSRNREKLLLSSSVLAIGSGFGPSYNAYEIDDICEEDN